MKWNAEYTLYLVTDRGLMSTDTLSEAVEQAILGGCTMVQLREKTADSRAFYDEALRIKAVTDKYKVPLIINDRVDIALAVDAAGVHVGQSDLPADVVRRMIGPDKLVGVSVGSVAEAQKAKRDGADYLGIGAMFATDTKKDAEVVSFETLMRIRQEVELPNVVIGGINETTAPQFSKSVTDGLAVVSAIIAQPDIQAAARHLRAIFEGNA